MLAVLQHELSMYYHSMRAYVFTALLLLLTGVGAMVYNINAAVSNFEYVLDLISIGLVVLIPFITMKVMSDERSQKTDQLLLSLPISTTDIVMGKFLALMVVLAVPMAVICIYPVVFAQYGQVFLPTSYGTILAFFFLGMALMCIGMFVSCLTESQSMAMGISVLIMVFLYYCDTLADYVASSRAGSVIGVIVVIALLALLVRYLTKSNLAGIIVGVILLAALIVAAVINPALMDGLFSTLMNQLSLFSRFETFVNGVFDVTVLVYDASVTAFFLFLCIQALEKRRYNG